MSLNIDYNLLPWMRDYSLTNDQKILNQMLDLGFRVSKFISFRDNTSNEVKNYLDIQKELFTNHVSLINTKIDNMLENNKNNTETLDYRMQSIEKSTSSTIEEVKSERERYIDILENVTGKLKTSALKGSIAENFLEDTIKALYPDYTLDVTAKTGHEADMQLSGEDIPKILIESKNYSNPVPSKEIVKFKNDLSRVNCDFGIFFSFNSKITGKDVMEIEKYDNTTILYVSGIDFNIEIVRLSMTTIIYLSRHNGYQKYVSGELLNRKTKDIIKALNGINELYTIVSKTRYTLQEEKKKICLSLDAIHNSYIENDVLIRNVLERIHTQISQKIAEIHCISEKDNIESIDNLLDDNCNKDFCRNVLGSISIIDRYKINKTGIGSYDVCVKDTDDKVSEISFTKTKCKLSIPNIKCNFTISKTELYLIDNFVSLLEKL